MGGCSKLKCNSKKYEYSKLLGRIKECYGKHAVFAEAMGLSERSVSLKLNGLRCWTQNEIEKCCEVLMFPYSEIPKYFFTLDVKN